MYFYDTVKVSFFTAGEEQSRKERDHHGSTKKTLCTLKYLCPSKYIASLIRCRISSDANQTRYNCSEALLWDQQYRGMDPYSGNVFTLKVPATYTLQKTNWTSFLNSDATST